MKIFYVLLVFSLQQAFAMEQSSPPTLQKSPSFSFLDQGLEASLGLNDGKIREILRRRTQENKQKVVIYVIDDGIELDAFEHDHLDKIKKIMYMDDNGLVQFKSIEGDDQVPKLKRQQSRKYLLNNYGDKKIWKTVNHIDSHGSHVMGIVAQTTRNAPNIEIVPVRIGLKDTSRGFKNKVDRDLLLNWLHIFQDLRCRFLDFLKIPIAQ